ncbi:phosphoribosylanthranilate isomerase [Saccharibacillus sp. CPCC 101409]|uniref:phosphoribosylanthranilate isomerase n=1 Tax=Saccharibacillus sp. CPCC 101409 TaxID=3058041 RepID=UPI0026741402|nr:phosphoribosylanthranilate isomerase [Saccharibacillus sp. CPCC 101409]MDO3409614.1 phosphoribosylanthranilate isomerase [Saccharibacillus sp. CPCC 101409]
MAGLPVDYIGIVFAPSKRRVEPEAAAAMLSEAFGAPAAEDTAEKGSPAAASERTRPKIAGVFVDPALPELRRTLEIVKLDVVQLHGAETPEYCREVRETFGVQVFKALSVKSDAALQQHAALVREEAARRAEEAASAYAGAVDALLVDTYDPLHGGGSGRTFNWELIPLYKKSAAAHGLPLFVAGGLTPDNAGELVRDYAPGGVDVSSGVETDGHKDIAKIISFVERVAIS